MRYRLSLAGSLIVLLLVTVTSAVPIPRPVLTLTIHCDQTALKAGDEVAITFVIKNEGNEPYEYPDRAYDRGGRMEEYKLSAMSQDGTPIPDPRAKRLGGLGGGMVSGGNLPPGKSFTKTIALNRWALVTKAGTYRVTGTYYPSGGNKSIVSAPIEIVLQPRTGEEMGEYVEGLSLRLKASLESPNKPEQEDLVQKLIFTCDRRIMPALINAWYEGRQGNTSGNMSFWAEEALNYYLPNDDRNTAAIVDAATQRGMADGMCSVLERHGCPREQLKKLIAISLSADHPAAWAEGALSAQHYCDNSFTPRLIAIAMNRKGIGRDQAISALAMNRTDASVAALKQLLKDTRVRKFRGTSIRQETAEAIRDAYLSRGNSEGRKLRSDDFGPEYQHPGN